LRLKLKLGGEISKIFEFFDLYVSSNSVKSSKAGANKGNARDIFFQGFSQKLKDNLSLIMIFLVQTRRRQIVKNLVGF
jgi:hypothetical protein